MPSAIPRVDDAIRTQAMHARLRAGSAGQVVAHFGTYGEGPWALLAPALSELMRQRPDVRVCLLGVRSDSAAANLASTQPAHADRVIGLGRQPADDLSIALQACDVALQPYADGASGRRTTLMAALMNGVPTVANRGAATEPAWDDEGGVSLVGDGSAPTLAGAVVDLLNSERARAQLGQRGRAMYDRHFAIERTVATLLGHRP